MKIIETERLILREFIIEDAPFIFKLLNTPGWLKYIGPRGVSGLQEAGKYLTEMIIPSYKKNGFGLYMMERKEDGAQLGMCGLIKRETLEDVDIGFAVLPEFEGNGYTTEASLAVIELASGFEKITKIVAITVPYNEPSIKVLEKIGMKYEKIINIPNDPEDLMLYVMEL